MITLGHHNLSSLRFFKFCPHCGGRFKVRKRHGITDLVCPSCHFVFYQNSKPTATAFLVNRQDRIMLVKRAIEPKKGWWDAPGGFLENGEDPLVGLRREVREELGVAIHDIGLLGIYMDTYQHGYTLHTLNIIYMARIRAGKVTPMDDVGRIKWFTVSEIPWSGLAFSWLRRALKDWTRRCPVK